MSDLLEASMPMCGHWKSDYPDSWSVRILGDLDTEIRVVCEAIIDVGSGQWYCLDEGPNIETHQLTDWLAAARKWAEVEATEPIWWKCTAHDSVAVTPGHRCDHAKLLYRRYSEVSDCDKVRVRLVPVSVGVTP